MRGKNQWSLRFTALSKLKPQTKLTNQLHRTKRSEATTLSCTDLCNNVTLQHVHLGRKTLLDISVNFIKNALKQRLQHIMFLHFSLVYKIWQLTMRKASPWLPIFFSKKNVSPAVAVNQHSWYPSTAHSVNITSIFDLTRTLYICTKSRGQVWSWKVSSSKTYRLRSMTIDENRYNR